MLKNLPLIAKLIIFYDHSASGKTVILRVSEGIGFLL